ncbi:NUDIX domain-containing protein [Amycolatopsis sp. FDAARGOS 1241]|uniref:NUDIX domain-containing protein n=1 Tax=Amycolatopsis sp. FDAARGOS 1241 TaxID=2778070 RepID=UPI00194DF2F7|nr:NUDIX domain-containing protein [Amycolatopsis sp. FDAARGOS 1241]QRP49998.1 NUDIX domain-containing protein [Amycolatopsis sp. FDAARGOS 1241]
MPGSDELVALYDRTGHAVGHALRSRVRAEGLWHAAGVVLVRSSDGKSVYVHLRTADKDIFPSTWDCWAGGVVAAGETPAECARRELAEELGVHGVEPEPLFTKIYDEGTVHCHNFAFEVRWDGPIRHQPEEIAEGRWMPLADLRAWVFDPASPFIPDGRAGVQEWFHRYG